MVYSEDRSTQKDTSSSAGASSLSDLIARLEKATGPDRELDLEIHIALNPDGDVARMTSTHPRGLHIPDGLAWELGTNCIIYENWSNGQCWSNGGYSVPSVTSSIDAAMTLVPEGHLWKCGYARFVPHVAEVVDYDTHRGSFVGECDYNRAIALCIAALKARSLPAI